MLNLTKTIESFVSDICFIDFQQPSAGHVQDISEEVVEDANILETLLGVLSDSFFEALDPTDQTGVIDIERIFIRSEAAALF